MIVRFATPNDSLELLKIYKQYIHTAITFECTPPTEQEFRERIEGIIKEYPYLVCEDDGKIVGYAYAHRHMERGVYGWNAELSVYIDRSFTSRGIGKELYIKLIELLKLQGIKNLYAGITVPNKKSEKLHTSLGFKLLGTYHNTGYKCSKWHDVSWFEKQIGNYELEPNNIIPINMIDKDKIIEILQKSLEEKY